MLNLCILAIHLKLTKLFMTNSVSIYEKIKNFNNKIEVDGDKSLSIRWALMASQAIGRSRAYNILNSEDVNNSLISLKKLGIKIKKKNNFCEIVSKGLNSFSYKNNTIVNAGNSGTFARLIMGVLSNCKNTVIIKGDKSLSNRDFKRVIKPLNLFGVKINSKNNRLPLKLKGTKFLRPIKYYEKKGSAQVKSCIMLAALNTNGETIIKCKKSRDHTEKLFKYLNLPIKIIKKKNFDIIKIFGKKQFKGFDYKIPGDISSASFFIALTLLRKNSKILIKNININNSRTGIIDVLKEMNAKIELKNKKIYNGEHIADIIVSSAKKLKAVNCPSNMNSRMIDEFLIIFLICAKAKGISYFRNLEELRNKESDRLKIAVNFLKMIGIKVVRNSNNVKIYGKPNLELKKKYTIKNFNKDHRVFMMTCIAALSLGGKWKIYDKDSINSSFPNFLSIIKFLGAKIK